MDVKKSSIHVPLFFAIGSYIIAVRNHLPAFKQTSFTCFKDSIRLIGSLALHQRNSFVSNIKDVLQIAPLITIDTINKYLETRKWILSKTVAGCKYANLSILYSASIFFSDLPWIEFEVIPLIFFPSSLS